MLFYLFATWGGGKYLVVEFNCMNIYIPSQDVTAAAQPKYS